MSSEAIFLNCAVELGLMSPEHARLVPERFDSRRDGPLGPWLVRAGVLAPDALPKIAARYQQYQQQTSPFPPSPQNAAYNPTPTPTPIPSYSPAPVQVPGSATPGSRGASGSAGSSEGSRDLRESLRKRSLLAPGERLGRYSVVSEIARGGMGAVYRALDARSQLVALKIMLAENADERALKRFEREIQLSKSLEHPNIIRTLDFGRDGERHFLVMEFVDGGSLSDVIGDEDVELRERVTLIRDIARGIAYAHGHGVVHRDLKPVNVLLDSEGIPKVADFGLARSLLPDEQLTKTGTSIGTPSYMSPEQVRGETSRLDERCDIWAMGVMAHELICGTRPFLGEQLPQLYKAIQESPPPALEDLVPEATGGLAGIIGKALEKRPEDRYQSAATMAEDLSRWLDTGRVSVAGQSAPSRLLRATMRRHRAIAIPILASLAIFVIGMLFIKARSEHVRAALELEKKTRRESFANAVAAVERRAPALLADAEKAESANDLEAAREPLESLRQLFTRIETISAAAPDDKLTSPPSLQALQIEMLARLTRVRSAGSTPREIAKITVELLSGLAEQPLDAEPAARLYPTLAEADLTLGLPDRALSRLAKLKEQAAETRLLRARILLRLGARRSALELLEAEDLRALPDVIALRAWIAATHGNQALAWTLIEESRDAGPQGQAWRRDAALRTASPEALSIALELGASSHVSDTLLLAQAQLASARPLDAHNLARAVLRDQSSSELAAITLEADIMLAPEQAGAIAREAWTKHREATSGEDDSWAPLLDLAHFLGEPEDPGVLVSDLLSRCRERFDSRRCLALRNLRASVADALGPTQKATVVGAADDPATRDLYVYSADLARSPDAAPPELVAAARTASLEADPESPFALRWRILNGEASAEPLQKLRMLYLAGRSPAARITRLAQELLLQEERLRCPAMRREAWSLLSLARRLEPWSLTILVTEIEARWRRNELAGAEGLVDRLNFLAPKLPLSLALRASQAFSANKPEEASSQLEGLRADESQHPIVVLMLARQALFHKDFAQCKQLCDRLAESHPDDDHPLVLRVELCRAQADEAATKAAERELANLRSTDGVTEDFKDNERARADDREAMTAFFSDILRRHPGSGPIRLRRALVLRARQDQDSVLAAYCDFAQVFLDQPHEFDSPNNDFQNSLRYTLSLQLLEQTVARETARSKNLAPQLAWAHALAIVLEYQAGQLQRQDLRATIPLLERAVQGFPAHLAPYMLRGFVRAILQEPGAQRDLERALRFEPDLTSALIPMALLEVRTGNRNAAFAYLDRARHKVEARGKAKRIEEFKPLLSDPRW